ncbi:TPA: AzlC family ABC transporter permease [Vibrio parahaemolyticus]|uniref:AzlC family ABC transporter permease n=1 Tax=Vibrio parahaemolyticus TaxID=670 RepID=UPI00040E83F6|nr:AzlC family ABC transporter permease [Vibrio parahaemolyticus]KJR19840.1 branched-chain amino acid ABC transporter permease [Vibrio parahaemolyticus]HCE1956810.1 AzlC family ABC transporter permease [Vibrio parahaemolyticus]HCE2689170.1 AzlC family ABC transporter permease [Vibrio parahaemolyticus]HCE2914292.1 AzlC family ABC transporter permease [Vibrio parahaemolyticus]HCG5138739.1 AzlC family ABC transporter permease [Vibrio parahaemolyticus]
MTENTSSFPRSSGELHEFTRADVWGGFTQLLPLSFFVVVFGLAFGVAAVQTGLDAFPTLLMSTLVFAGASQFATLEMWGAEVPLVPVLITVFAINARHLLMGATLYPWLRQLPPHKRYGIMLLASDANWAMAMNAFGKKEPGFGLLVGGGLALLGFWIVGTWMGIYFGGAIKDPVSLGLDMVMGCFLLSMVAGGPKNLRIFAIWSMAAASSLMAYWYLPENSHVVVGAIAGGILGACWKEKKA